MHSFVRTCKKLREDEAARLFHQIVSAVAHCHDNGLVLRDLKLRKFVFKNEERSLVKLESLEDTYILDGLDDSLSDKHGCPAYVSPEILNANGSYSGKAADVWSLGVMLYTILVGRYPFHDVEPGSLFTKIRRGHFNIPETLTPRPTGRAPHLAGDPAAPVVPLLRGARGVAGHGRAEREQEQMVPEVNMEEELEQFFS
uniref:Tribbles homolog 2 n=1 Tax=Neogobius melanostomus TaxID=47308 RepID=A0A8C6SDJ0_9GOBI